jgi:hypothetical protein
MAEGSAVEPPLHKLLAKSIVILPIKDEVEVLLIGTVARVIEVVMRA